MNKRNTEDLLKELKQELNKTKFNKYKPLQEEQAPVSSLLNELSTEIPKDPMIEYLNNFKDMLLTEDYWGLHKMISTFGLSKEEIDAELINYGIEV